MTKLNDKPVQVNLFGTNPFGDCGKAPDMWTVTRFRSSHHLTSHVETCRLEELIHQSRGLPSRTMIHQAGRLIAYITLRGTVYHYGTHFVETT
jgi:hypothetical protein